MSGRNSILALVASVALAVTACSDQTTAPRPSGSVGDRPNGTPSQPIIVPSSVEWQERARNLVAANNLSPLAAARIFSALSVAQYRAVMAIQFPDGNGDTPEPAATRMNGGGQHMLEGRRGAVAGASAQVLSFFFAGASGSLEQEVRRQGELTESGVVHPAFTRGVAFGRTAGNALVERVKNDGFTTPWTGTVPVGPGKWVANGPPAGATFGGVTPYFLTSGSQFRSPPPPAFDSPAFLADLAEIRTLSDTRTPAQTSSAVSWNYGTGTFTPVGYWNLTASNYVVVKAMDELEATRTFALTNAAMMDALIACWESKYYHWTLRPSQADQAITMTFGLPNHPSYPSGHSCVSAAGAGVLAELFPERKAELQTWVTEAGLSRMYAGIHYRFDITAGKNLGEAVAQWALANANLIN